MHRVRCDAKQIIFRSPDELGGFDTQEPQVRLLRDIFDIRLIAQFRAQKAVQVWTVLVQHFFDGPRLGLLHVLFLNQF